MPIGHIHTADSKGYFVQGRHLGACLYINCLNISIKKRLILGFPDLKYLIAQ